MATIKIKRGDTAPALRYTFPAEVDLTDATVAFIMSPRPGGQSVVVAPAAVLTTEPPVAEYTWSQGDTETDGSYYAEFEVSFADGRVQRFPSSGYLRIDIGQWLDSSVPIGGDGPIPPQRQWLTVADLGGAVAEQVTGQVDALVTEQVLPRVADIAATAAAPAAQAAVAEAMPRIEATITDAAGQAAASAAEQAAPAAAAAAFDAAQPRIDAATDIAANNAAATVLTSYEKKVLYTSDFSSLDGWLSESAARITASAVAGSMRIQAVAGQTSPGFVRRDAYLTRFSGSILRVSATFTAESATLLIRPRIRFRNSAGNIIEISGAEKGGWIPGQPVTQMWDIGSPGPDYTEVQVSLRIANYAANPAIEVLNSIRVEDSTIENRLPKRTEFSTIAEAQGGVTLGYTSIKTGDLLWQLSNIDPVLTTGDGRKWIPADPVTPQHFGAVGNADPITFAGTDDTIPLRRAMEWTARNNRWLVLNRKYLRDNTTLTLQPSIGGLDLRIRGEAGNAIVCPDGASVRRDALVLSSTARPRDVALHGLNFVGPWTQGTQVGSNFVSGQWVRDLDINECSFTGSRRGAVGCTGPTSSFAYRARIRNSHFSMNATGGGDIRNTKICFVDGNHFEYAWDDVVGIHNDDGQYTLDRIHIVTNNTFYQCQGVCASGGASTTIANNRFSMCFGRAIGVFGWATFHSLSITGNVIENMFNQEFMSGVLVPRSDAIYVTLQNAVTKLGLSGFEWETDGGGRIISPYANNYKIGRTEGQGTIVRAASPMHSVLIDGNVITRTLAPSPSWASYGLPNPIRTRLGVYTGEITRGMMLDRGIRFEGGSRGCRISNNIVDGAVVCLDASEYIVGQESPVSNHKALSISGNTFRNFANSGVRLFGVTGDADVFGNTFDGDPLFENASRNADGTWNFAGTSACGALYGSDSVNMNVVVHSNNFRNLRRIVEGALPNCLFTGNFVYCDPVSDVDAGNVGIGDFGGSIARIGTLIVELGNPSLPDFGRIASSSLVSATSVPSSGKYARGHVVKALAPTKDASGRVITGWLRLTTGSGHALGSDWIELLG